MNLSNFTGGNTSAGHLVRGGEICAWDDAAGTDSGDLAMQITPFIMGAAEAWWSPRAYTSGVAVDEGRAHHHRCRMGQRGMATHPIYAFGARFPPAPPLSSLHPSRLRPRRFSQQQQVPFAHKSLK